MFNYNNAANIVCLQLVLKLIYVLAGERNWMYLCTYSTNALDGVAENADLSFQMTYYTNILGLPPKDFTLPAVPMLL
jgi:hypothetical protein